MNTLIVLTHLLSDPIVAVAQHNLAIVFGITDTIGTDLVATIRKIVGPIVILAVGLVALTYLTKRQVTQFLQFAALAVLIGVFFYTNAIVAVAEFIGKQFGGGSVQP